MSPNLTTRRKQPWRVISILDDRGSVRDLVSPVDRGEWRDMPRWGSRKREYIQKLSPERKAELDHIQHASRVYGGFCGFTAIGSSSLARWLLTPVLIGMPSWLVTGAPVVLTGVLIWPLFPIISWMHRRGAAPQLRAAYLAANRCPSCGFDLAGLPSAPDDNVLCPECGASWRLSPTSAPHKSIPPSGRLTNTPKV